jgi:hypothetical protein
MTSSRSGEPVKLGLFSANIAARNTGAEAVSTVQATEEIGLESLWTGEQIFTPKVIDTPYPFDPSGKSPAASTAEELTHAADILDDECAAIELTVYARKVEADALSTRIEEFLRAGVSRVILTKVPEPFLRDLVATLYNRFGVSVS